LFFFLKRRVTEYVEAITNCFRHGRLVSWYPETRNRHRTRRIMVRNNPSSPQCLTPPPTYIDESVPPDSTWQLFSLLHIHHRNKSCLVAALNKERKSTVWRDPNSCQFKMIPKRKKNETQNVQIVGESYLRRFPVFARIPSCRRERSVRGETIFDRNYARRVNGCRLNESPGIWISHT
jgi:hypothetical protein